MITWKICVDGVEMAHYNFAEDVHEDTVIQKAVSNPMIKSILMNRQHIMNEVVDIGPDRKMVDITTRELMEQVFLAE